MEILLSRSEDISPDGDTTIEYDVRWSHTSGVEKEI